MLCLAPCLRPRGSACAFLRSLPPAANVHMPSPPSSSCFFFWWNLLICLQSHVGLLNLRVPSCCQRSDWIFRLPYFAWWVCLFQLILISLSGDWRILDITHRQKRSIRNFDLKPNKHSTLCLDPPSGVLSSSSEWITNNIRNNLIYSASF